VTDRQTNGEIYDTHTLMCSEEIASIACIWTAL